MRSWTVVVSLLLAGCGNSESPEPSAVVNFRLIAPLCSSVLAMEFSIDAIVVATDTFRVGLSGARTVSNDFQVSAGTHALGARVVGGFIWPTRNVVVRAGTTVTDSLDFYCS